MLSFFIIGFAYCSIMGNLYHNVLSNELLSINSEKLGIKNIEEIKKASNGMLYWKKNNPDYLIDASYVSYLESLTIESEHERKNLLNSSIQYLDSSIRLRPLFPDAYSQKADLMDYRGDSLKDVYTVLRSVYQFGPFEKDTAETSIKILFSHWDKLNIEQKKIALKFITEHDKYGIKNWRLNEIFKFSPNKERMCSVAILAHIPLWTCGNYKSKS
ncbi:hypothetical protein [Vibrio salinus]|uniref:hypothetical protein n=1 Tax=Vibrio salinus TaxID=2899784 RepID=UPI001E5C7C7F|nr:hypothetical protein [Vibrio salinus]MCE0493309.1 hypothetical protein [Vibrio salinus]